MADVNRANNLVSRPFELVDARCAQNGSTAQPVRATTSANPVALHALQQTERSGCYLVNLLLELELSAKTVDIQRRIQKRNLLFPVQKLDELYVNASELV